MFRDGATVSRLLADGAGALQGASGSPGLDARLLLAHAMGRRREWLYAHGDEPVCGGSGRAFWSLVKRRKSGEPVAYLLGRKHFFNRKFTVTPATLVPRPETELLVEIALARFGEQKLTVADLGTGAGVIAVSLADARRAWQVHAVDNSAAALAVARQNARGLANMTFVQASWCDAFAAGALDLIVSNPPYVRAGDPHLGALSHEPAAALVAGPGGLECICAIVDAALPCLSAGGCLLVEHGHDQGDDVRGLFRKAGYAEIATASDMSGQPRVTSGRKPA